MSFPSPSVEEMGQQLLLEAEQCRGQLIHSGDFRQSWLREANILIRKG